MATPWNKIKAEWLKGGKTYKQLAEKYQIKEGTIKNRASKEGWQKEKLLIGDKVSTELRERVARTRVNHLEKLIAANEALLDGLVKTAELIQKNPFQMLTDATGTLRNAESFAKAIETAARTQRDLYRLPNIDQKFAAKKWREQLKLEKAKTKEAEGGDQQVMLVIHEPPEEGAEA